MSEAQQRELVSVLVIDDDDDIRDTLSEIMQDLGYSVATAGNGADALMKLRGLKPQLILLDLSMPIMDGHEFRAEQVRDPALAEIPTVVMTAADRAREKTAAMKPSDVLAKPVKLDVLLRQLRRYCGASSA